jgi:hypothetical protein
MRVKATRVVDRRGIQTNLFVREALDQSHVLYLSELIENGVELKAMDVTEIDGHLEYVDGRHRNEAYALTNVEKVKVRELEFDDENEMIAYAYKSNTGGPKPPTPQDTEHTVKLLIERKQTIKQISELLALPIGMTRRYVAELKSRMSRATLQKAVDLVVNEGLSVAKAAHQQGVDLDKLKEALSGKQKKLGAGLPEIIAGFSKRYQSLGQKNTAAIKKVRDMYEDGDATEKQIHAFFKHVQKLHSKGERSLADALNRFEADVKSAKADVSKGG